MKLEEYSWSRASFNLSGGEYDESIDIQLCGDGEIEISIDGRGSHDDRYIYLTIPDLELLLEAVTKTLAAAKAFKEEQ